MISKSILSSSGRYLGEFGEGFILLYSLLHESEVSLEARRHTLPCLLAPGVGR